MEHTTKSSPKDVFLYLLMMVALYISAGSFINLVFAIIDRVFPDPASYNYAGRSFTFAIASLIVIFPVFLWVTGLLRREVVATKEKAEIKIRKWLISFTLFATALLMIGDLIALIRNFLEGGLSARFLAQVVVIFIVAGAIFKYYLHDLKHPGVSNTLTKSFTWGSIAFVAIAVITGFVYSGSPFRAHSEKLDAQRINDLQVIQNQIVYFWQQKNKLPATLAELTDPISGFQAPVDPVTGMPYTYTTTGNLSFELCAEFLLASHEAGAYGREVPRAFPVGPYGVVGENWAHESGISCFSRTIDPDLYGNKVPVR